MNIRKASVGDLARIAEIEVFNYRLNFYPIFRNDEYYFADLTVPELMEEYEKDIDSFCVYDDGAVKGFIRTEGEELRKLFVEPVLQSGGIGAALLGYARDVLGINHLWALEKNTRAIAFYRRHGFLLTDERIPEEDTDEYLVHMRLENGELTKHKKG